MYSEILCEAIEYSVLAVVGSNGRCMLDIKLLHLCEGTVLCTREAGISTKRHLKFKSVKFQQMGIGSLITVAGKTQFRKINTINCKCYRLEQ